MYFAKLHQERSYVLALANAPQVEGMYISGEKGGWSFRNYGEFLLMGGEQHRTGENQQGGRYERLRQKAREWFPQSREVYHWSAQDGMTPDGVPYLSLIHIFSPISERTPRTERRSTTYETI